MKILAKYPTSMWCKYARTEFISGVKNDGKPKISRRVLSPRICAK
jgi:hypothetical protein